MKKTTSKNANALKVKLETNSERTATAQAECLCRAVRLEIDFPAFWAWHDHSPASRRAHGAAYATYVGSWRSRFRVTAGASNITHFEDTETHTVRHFCSRCGTPVYYERGHSPKMVNIPRALFLTRIGREPRYHIGIEDSPDLGLPRGEPGAAERLSRRGLESRQARGQKAMTGVDERECAQPAGSSRPLAGQGHT